MKAWHNNWLQLR